ncbi:MAG: DMT family transporter [Candidatus Thorarchaeota archaeon]
MNATPTISKIAMLLSGICMGSVSLFIILLKNYPIYSIVFFRGLFGTFFLTIVMFLTKSFSINFIKESFKYHWKYLIIIAITNPLVILFYFMTIKISGSAFAVFLLYTSGLYLLLLLTFTREEKISKLNYVCFTLAIIGVFIIMEFWTGNILIYGLMFGLFSGFTLGILIFSKKKIYNHRKKIAFLLMKRGNFDILLTWFSTLFILILFSPYGFNALFNLTLSDLFISLSLGFIPTAFAFTLYNIGVKNDHAGNIIILSYSEIIVAVIINLFFFPTFSIFTIIGGCLVILANIIILRFDK